MTPSDLNGSKIDKLMKPGPGEGILSDKTGPSEGSEVTHAP